MVAQRAFERLQHDNPAAFAADIAVGARIERIAAAAARQHPSLSETDKRIG
jgi:hypothetical protein